MPMRKGRTTGQEAAHERKIDLALKSEYGEGQEYDARETPGKKHCRHTALVS